MELDYPQDLVVASAYFDGIREGVFVTARSGSRRSPPPITPRAAFPRRSDSAASHRGDTPGCYNSSGVAIAYQLHNRWPTTTLVGEAEAFPAKERVTWR